LALCFQAAPTVGVDSPPPTAYGGATKSYIGE
jgi:hypothetical protein